MKRLGLLLATIVSFSSPALAQGCAQCRDNMQATPPRTQQAYRRAIVLLVVAAGTIFVGTVVLLKRSR